MNPDREDLNDRYLDAALRDALGPNVDLTRRVLRAAGRAEPSRPRVIALPRRAPVWRPLAAAAAVLVVAGLGVYALVQVLPADRPDQSAPAAATRPANEAAPAPAPRPHDPVPGVAPVTRPDEAAPPRPKANEPEFEPLPPLPEPAPTPPDEVKRPETPAPEPRLPDGEVKRDPEPEYPEGWTDPPESWPGKLPEGTAPGERAVLCAAIRPSRKDGVRVADGGKWKPLAAGQVLRDGDRVKVTGWADFTLGDGTLLRLDGEMALTLEDKTTVARLFGGVLYADCALPLLVRHEALGVTLTGQALVQYRPRALDVSVLLGTATAAARELGAGRAARLDADGFGRDRAVAFADLQREHRMLKESPERKAVREDFDAYKGEIWGGEVTAGVLRGGHDKVRGLAFHFGPVPLRGNEVVRLRYRVTKRVDLVMQFGTTGDGNFRHVIRGVESGKWLEAEIPVSAFFTNMDETQKLAAGNAVRRFQLHDDDGRPVESEIDWFEIVSRP
ncbi:MAG: hypothetical protein HS108_03945 [Planctomycetes bacterium]|jgi:hypothetical protein|nr:hypothetical protein [Planctomycetota bacterium]MCL4731085.1 hypothetical protein [Planctomycetota bacterium]